MKINIKRTDARVEGAKRQRVPYTIEWTCPTCGKEHQDDYAGSQLYISYPIFGEPENLVLCCFECNYEGEIQVVLDVTLVKS